MLAFCAVPVAVVARALLVGREDVVGFADFDEAGGCGGVGGVEVGMVALGECVELSVGVVSDGAIPASNQYSRVRAVGLQLLPLKVSRIVAEVSMLFSLCTAKSKLFIQAIHRFQLKPVDEGNEGFSDAYFLISLADAF